MNTGEQIGFLILVIVPGIITVIVWAILGALIILLVQAIVRKSRLRKKVIAVTAIFLIWYPFWTIFPGELLAKRECRLQGGLTINKPIAPVEGYLRSYTTFEPILEELAVKKFKYVEIMIEGSTPIQRLAYKWFPEHHVGLRDPEIHRYYLGPLSAKPKSHCYGPYKVEKKYIPDTLCVAYKNADAPLSQYKLVNEEYSNYFPLKINWKVSKIIDLQSDQLAAEYKSFKHSYSFGLYSSRTMFDCENKEAKNKFDQLIVPAKANEFIKDLDTESPVYKFYNP
jgi:hypothetical protein